MHLLPGFDEFVLGYTDRTAQLSKEHFLRIVPGGNGVFSSTVIVNGAIVGTWRREKATAKRVTVSLAPFGPLSESNACGGAAAARALRRLPRRGGHARLGVRRQVIEPGEARELLQREAERRRVSRDGGTQVVGVDVFADHDIHP